MGRSALFFFTACAASIWLSPARALESPWIIGAQADTRLLADHGRNAPARAGVEIKLKPGWKTYWRYPGDAGVPPRFDWSGSENLAAADVKWPAPERFVDESGAKSIGYRGHIVFPILVRPADPARPVRLKLKFDFAVCDKLCVPADADLALEIPAGAGAPLDLLDQAERRVPRRVAVGENIAGLAVSRVSLERGAKPRVFVDGSAAESSADLFAEGPTPDWALPVPTPIAGAPSGQQRFAFELDGMPPGATEEDAVLRLTAIAENQAIEVTTVADGK